MHIDDNNDNAKDIYTPLNSDGIRNSAAAEQSSKPEAYEARIVFKMEKGMSYDETFKNYDYTEHTSHEPDPYTPVPGQILK